MIEKIRILILLPVVYTEGLKYALEDRKKLIHEIDRRLRGVVKLEVVSLEKGTSSIECFYDEAVNTPYILEKAKEAKEEGYDAIVIDCFGDPGLDAIREIVNIPVLGANESSCHLVAQLAHRFSIINILPETEHQIKSLVVKYGLFQQVASTITINIPVLELEKDPERSITTIAQAIEKAVREDGASAVVLGCTGMSSLVRGVRCQLKAKGVNVPVIEPLRATVYMAIAWVLTGVSQSKEAYKPPRSKLIKL